MERKTASSCASENSPPIETESVPFPKFWSLPPRLSRRSRFRHWRRDLVFRFIYFLARVLLGLGIERAARLAEKIGPLLFFLQRRERRIALENLELAWGREMDAAERSRIARRVFRCAALSGVESLWMSRWTELCRWLSFEVDGRDRLERALGKGKGVICITAHFGSWEVMAAETAQLGYPVHIVAREMKDPRLEAWVRGVREACGIRVVPRGRNPLSMVRILGRGGMLGLMIDLDTRSGQGIFVDFFGNKAYTQTGPFILARKTGAVLVPSLCYREGINRLRFFFGEPWEIVPSDDAEADIRQAAERATGYLEDRIRERPEQWAWFHKRWKTTPEHFERKQAAK